MRALRGFPHNNAAVASRRVRLRFWAIRAAPLPASGIDPGTRLSGKATHAGPGEPNA